MFFIPIVSIVAFIVILAGLKWEWVELTDDQVVNYVHSIIGMIVLLLSLVQVIYSILGFEVYFCSPFVLYFIKDYYGFI